ncbi:MAG: hypothetical protein ACHBN1_06295 [Heteroscytonema crispum UTEX LB 1556]
MAEGKIFMRSHIYAQLRRENLSFQCPMPLKFTQSSLSRKSVCIA